MHPVPGSDFLQWAAKADVGFHPQYPDHLALLPPVDHARFWVLRADAATWPPLIASLLGGLDEWRAGYLWPRGGAWPTAAWSKSPNEHVRDVMLRGAGIPDGWAGAIRFDQAEEHLVIAVLFAVVAFGWCAPDDLFFVPDHARQIVRTDHHDVLHAECRSEERVAQLVGHMSAAGYELPTALPDCTFIRPTWMRGDGA